MIFKVLTFFMKKEFGLAEEMTIAQFEQVFDKVMSKELST